MQRSYTAVRVRAAFGAALLVCLLGWTSTAAAQGLPDCAPDKTVGVTLTSQEKALDAPLVATHEIAVAAEFTGTVIDVSMKPPAGVRVLHPRAHGESVLFIVPVAASVPITVSWRQATDPSDPTSDPEDPSASCIGSRVVTLPVKAANRSRAVKTVGWRQGFSNFAIVPALKRPDLSPVEVSIRTTSRVRFPSATTKARTMVVPMRTADQVKYGFRLPNLAHITVAKKCRFYLLICGSVFSEVVRLYVDTEALRRGIEKGDLNGAVALLARTQPSLAAARYGLAVQTGPGVARQGAPRPFGYDVQAKQSGRLLARVRIAGRCVELRDSRGIFTQCRIARSSKQL